MCRRPWPNASPSIRIVTRSLAAYWPRDVANAPIAISSSAPVRIRTRAQPIATPNVAFTTRLEKMDATTATLTELVQAFPRLFKAQPPMVPGYVDDGWHDLTTDLFARIDGQLSDAQARRFQVVQIKEKLGGLRVYFRIDGPPDRQKASDAGPSGAEASQDHRLRHEVLALIASAQDEASRRCQVCGCGGRLRRFPGLLRVLCERHAPDPPQSVYEASSLSST